MAYVMLEASVRTHPKFLSAGSEACWLWVCGLGYCQDGLTDGFIPHDAINYLGVKRAKQLAQRLVSVRLWEVVPGGWQMHDYLKHNKSARKIRETMRLRQAGGKKGGRPKVTSKVNLNGKPSKAEEANHPENPILPTYLPTVLPTDKTVSSATSSTPPEPALLIFPTVGKLKTWALTQSQVGEWGELYPGLDVLAECRKGLAWVHANQPKTAKGMPAFLVSWFNRATNRGGIRAPTAPAQQQARDYGADHHCPHTPECNGRFACVQRQQAEAQREAV